MGNENLIVCSGAEKFAEYFGFEFPTEAWCEYAPLGVYLVQTRAAELPKKLS